MAINSLADYEAAVRDKILFRYVSGLTAGRNISSGWRSLSRVSTTPIPAAVPIPANTANGVVPVAGDTGFPTLPTWPNVGYVSSINVTPNIGTAFAHARYILYDRLFQAGAYNVNNTSQTLTSQPSYSGRIPGGDYSGTQLWIEYGSAPSGAPTLTVTYTDQAGNTGHSTSITMTSWNGSIGDIQQLPLAAGDSGLQTIESVTTTATGSGTFSLVVVRPLAMVTMPAQLDTIRPLEWLGPRRIYSTSALAWVSNGTTPTASQTTSIPGGDFIVEVAGN